MAAISLKCFSCGHEMSFASPPGRRDECAKCGADVHACRNCRHYDKNVYNECREPQADVVKERDRANFCDFFSAGGQSGGAGAQKNDLLAAAEALFKKK